MTRERTIDEKQLKIACLSKGVKYVDVADCLGVSLSTLYYKIKHNSFQGWEAARLADFLGVNAETMFSVTDYTNPDAGNEDGGEETINGNDAETVVADAVN